MKRVHRQPPPRHVVRSSRSSRRSSGRCARGARGTAAARSAGLIACSGRVPTPGLTSRGTCADSPEALGETPSRRAAPGWQLRPRTAAPEVDQATGGRFGRIRPLPETDEDREPRHRERSGDLLERRLDLRETGRSRGAGRRRPRRPGSRPVRRRHPVPARRSARCEPRTNRPGPAAVRARRTARRLIAFDVLHLAESGQPGSVGAEGVGEDGVGTAGDVAVVDGGDRFGVAQAPERGVVASGIETRRR